MDERKREMVILIADDDAGHVHLIVKNLRRAGLSNRIERFEDGEQALEFLFGEADRRREPDTPYILFLDIRMPRVDGIEVLRKIKDHPELRKMPVVMLTTTDDPREVERCHAVGCSNYVIKPVDFEKFASTILDLGLFVTLVKVPEIA